MCFQVQCVTNLTIRGILFYTLYFSYLLCLETQMLVSQVKTQLPASGAGRFDL